MRVSIVSAIHDDELNPELWFKALDRQTVPHSDYQIILVDSEHQIDYEGPLAELRAKTKSSMNMNYHRVPLGGRSRALNHALELATGDLIIFLAGDFLAPPDFIRAHLLFHEAHPEAEAVGISSAILLPEIRTPISSWLENSGQLFGVPFHAGMSSVPEDFFYVGNASVKRALLARAGRFDERFAHHAWDDFEFGQRLRAAGMKAAYVLGARADHLHHIELARRERSMQCAGEAAWVYLLDHSDIHGWLNPARVTRFRRWLRVIIARIRLAMLRDANAQANFWQAKLDDAFAEGYRNAAKGDRSQRANELVQIENELG